MKKSVIVLVVIALLLGGLVLGSYNRLVTLNEGVSGAWAQVETQLQRRSDLIPNLVETVKGYARHEQETFTAIADARAKLAGARTIDEKVAASRQLDGALARLLVIVERYPALRANENFIRLQDELAGTENRISVARQRYNDAVREYNVAVKRFPTVLIAGMLNLGPKEAYYRADEPARQAPKVEF